MIALPFVYFSILGAFFFYKEKSWGMDLAATTLLIAISFFAIMVDINDVYGDYGINEKCYTFPTLLLFCVQWTLVLWPIHIISRIPFEKHPAIKDKLLYIIFTLVAVSSLLMIVNNIDKIRDAMIMDFVDVRHEHYQDMQSGASGEANYFMLIPNILVSTPFPTLALFFWFYMKAFIKCPMFLRAGMLISSIVQAILAIITAGRAAMIYWIFDFFMLYSFFLRYLTVSVKRKINWIASAIGILVAIIFVNITISRFTEAGRNTDPLVSVYGYAGQHVNNFCMMIQEGDAAPFQIGRIFPLTNKIINGKSFRLFDHYEEINKHINILVNVFDTFGGEIYLDIGWFGYISFFILLMFLTFLIKNYWHEMSFNNIFILVIAIAFFTRGLFAWPFTGHYTSVALVLMLMNCYLFKFAFKI